MQLSQGGQGGSFSGGPGQERRGGHRSGGSEGTARGASVTAVCDMSVLLHQLVLMAGIEPPGKPAPAESRHMSLESLFLLQIFILILSECLALLEPSESCSLSSGSLSTAASFLRPEVPCPCVCGCP